MTQVTRQVLWLADKQALVLFDRVSSTNAAYKKKWLLHTPNKPAGGTETVVKGSASDGIAIADGATIPDNMLISTNGTGKLFHQVLLPANYEVNKVGGPNYRYYVETDGNDDNGYNGSNQNGGYTTPQWYHDAGDWRIEVTPKVRQVSDTFLNILWPRQYGDYPFSVPVSQVLRNDAVATVMQAGDAVVGFGTRGRSAGTWRTRWMRRGRRRTAWSIWRRMRPTGCCAATAVCSRCRPAPGRAAVRRPGRRAARRDDQPDAAVPAGGCQPGRLRGRGGSADAGRQFRHGIGRSRL